jgi:hypothetical protein
MAARMMTRGMSVTDRIVAWFMMSALALALLQTAQTAALPAHFV